MTNSLATTQQDEYLDGLLKTARIHSNRLFTTLEHLQPNIPLSSDDVLNFTMDDFLYWDMFVLRFSKLQDLMGSKIFKAVLESVEQATDSMTLIDRLNALEKLGAIDDSNEWKDLRDMRNHLSHEYPDAPEITATNLNYAFELAPKLLKTLEKVETFVRNVRERSGM